MLHLRDEVEARLRNEISDDIFSREILSITIRLPLSGQNANLFCDDLKAHASLPFVKSNRAYTCARFSLELAAKHL
jgi:hypothetical protein